MLITSCCRTGFPISQECLPHTGKLQFLNDTLATPLSGFSSCADFSSGRAYPDLHTQPNNRLNIFLASVSQMMKV